MKRILIAIVAILCLSAQVSAINFGNFATNIVQSKLNAFAKDLGPVLGGGTYSGANCGFPGFDISAKLVMVSSASSDDVILPANSAFGLPFAQIEVGLPMNIIPMFRIFTISPENGGTLTVMGGGIKYKLSDDQAILPAVAVSGTYHFFSGYSAFDFNALSFNLILSKGLSPLPVSLYAGAGVDFSNITSKVPGLGLGVTGSGTSFRYNIGARLTILPVIYINGDIGYANSSLAYSFGAGAAF